MDQPNIKAFIIGDPHFQKDTVHEDRIFVEETIKHAKESKPNFIVILGDTLHTHETVDVNASNVAYSFIKQLRDIAHVYLIIGNHDFIDNKQFLTTNHAFTTYKEWKGITVVDYPILETIQGKTFVFCPYVEPGRFLEALNLLSDSENFWEMADCVFAHQEIRNFNLRKTIPSKIGDAWDEGYPPIISGHLHTPQNKNNVFYPGASKQVTFGELDDKWLWEVEFDESDCEEGALTPFTIRKIKINVNEKKVKNISVEEANKCLTQPPKQNTKLVITGTAEELLLLKKEGKKTELESKGYAVQLISKGNNVSPASTSGTFLKDELKIPFMELFQKDVETSNDENVKNAFRKVFGVM